jgi:hypothetical protein
MKIELARMRPLSRAEVASYHLSDHGELAAARELAGRRSAVDAHLWDNPSKHL